MAEMDFFALASALARDAADITISAQNEAAVRVLKKEAMLTEDQAKAVIVAIAKGQVPAVKISY